MSCSSPSRQFGFLSPRNLYARLMTLLSLSSCQPEESVTPAAPRPVSRSEIHRNHQNKNYQIDPISPNRIQISILQTLFKQFPHPARAWPQAFRGDP